MLCGLWFETAATFSFYGNVMSHICFDFIGIQN